MIRHTPIQITKLLVLFVVSCSFSLYACQNAVADNYVVQGPFVNPAPGSYIPTPGQVTGKEYTDHLDKNDANPPVGDPLRVLRFDGAGGTQNGFNYSGSFVLPRGPIDDPGREVDAIAGPSDALFNSVNNNQSALLLSSQGDPIAPILSHSISGSTAVWATIGQVDAAGPNDPGVVDLDALEVWGGENLGDSRHFSLEGDPGFISIWTYDGVNTSVPFVTTAQIAGALGQTNLLPLIDLDALMVGPESILFSIRPTSDGQFDGGEIWFWDFANPATFLVHGGVTWDTANDVTKLLGSENVDALEAVSAVPEPSSIVLAAFGLLSLIACRWRRKR